MRGIYVYPCLVGTFLLGIFVGSCKEIEVEGKVNLSDLLELFATITVGVVLVNRFQRQESTERQEKSILIEDVRALRGVIDSAHKAFAEAYERGTITQDDQRALNDLNQTFSVELTAVGKILESMGAVDKVPALKQLRQDRLKYKRIVTDYPPGGFSKQVAAREVGARVKLQNTIRALTLEINAI